MPTSVLKPSTVPKDPDAMMEDAQQEEGYDVADSPTKPHKKRKKENEAPEGEGEKKGKTKRAQPDS